MQYLYDDNKIRYSLISTNGNKPINWIFIPGGPGCDSSYFLSLTKLLNLSGNCWLIDFPGNGSHNIEPYNFDHWLEIFIPMIQKFKNPVIVGHSFGGKLALLFKKLENLLLGLVILNSSPCLWLEEAEKFAQEHKLPDLSADMQNFVQDPSQKTFKNALAACMPYYFPPKTLELGYKLLEPIAFTYEPAVWWQKKAIEISYNATWIPEKVKTIIIGSEFDGIVPFSLFEKDVRFNRNNIEKIFIKGAGHLPWIEEPQIISKIFERFECSLLV